MPQKIIAVTGATGLQGGSVVKYLLQDGTFAIRAITRNPDSPAAVALSSQGVRVVKADFRDSASLEKAFEGAHGVFGVTNLRVIKDWEPGVGADGERSQGKAMVDAAKSAGVEHFVWSTLDHSHLRMPHGESKADVDDYLKASGVPRTSLFTCFYFENLIGSLAFRKRPDESFDFPLPFVTDAPFAAYSVADTGALALVAFKHPEEWLGKDILVASEFLSARDIAKTINEVSGKTVHVQEVTHEQFQALKGNSLPEEVHLGLEFLFHFNTPPWRDPELSRKLHPKMQTFRQWVEENVNKILV